MVLPEAVPPAQAPVGAASSRAQALGVRSLKKRDALTSHADEEGLRPTARKQLQQYMVSTAHAAAAPLTYHPSMLGTLPVLAQYFKPSTAC